MSCSVVTGGIQPQFLKITHTELIQGSPIDRQIIIEGEAGFDTPPAPPPFNQRLTIFSAQPPAGQGQIQVWVEYRFLPATQAGPEDLVTTPRITGPDPMAFAFQINPSSVTTGNLQYRILGTRLVNGVAVSTTPIAYPREINGVPQYITMGVQANALQVIGAEGGRLNLPNGNPSVGTAHLDVPKGLFPTPNAITLDEIPTNGPEAPPGLPTAVRMYKLTSQQEAHGNMLLSLLYPDFEFPRGQDGVVDGTTAPVSTLGVMWWDGFSWRKLGGTVNTKDNTINAKIGYFGIFAVVPNASVTAEEMRPAERIITPNGDGKNDVAVFTFGGVTDNIKVEIFDMTGHRVRTIYSDTDPGWDGRDDSGSIVESGVYIYQYRADGKLVSGVIAVAK